ncbi:MAG: 4-hydroxy-tetrahydrodipicolinate reductase [FCB group bacterium]|jgi:4-hydroxy-tetrahydrodipicolinate reductase
MNNNLPKIAIVGYGFMGKEIELLAKQQQFIVTDIFDIDSPIEPQKSYDFEVAIDFTLPDAVMENIKILSNMQKNIVLGTTGWLHKESIIKDMVKFSGIGFIHSSNFSIGMQMFSRTLRYASQLMNKIDGYDIMLHEIHHKRKKDSPSGTAMTLADIIIKEVDLKKEIITYAMDGPIAPEQLHVSSTRGGEIFGTHTVYIDSLADTIELTHRAKNRSGFAMGALTAAKWIHGKKGFFDFDEMLKNLWE